jgi:hypothetical protein
MSSKFEDMFGRRVPLLGAEIILAAYLAFIASHSVTPEGATALYAAMSTVIAAFALTAKDYFTDIAAEKAQ